MNRIERKTAVPLDELLRQMLKQSGLGASHNTHRVYEAWDRASGAAEYTLRRFYRDGTLTVTLNNSAVRGQLFFQKDLLLEKINGILEDDPLFLKDYEACGLVKKLVLK